MEQVKNYKPVNEPENYQNALRDLKMIKEIKENKIIPSDPILNFGEYGVFYQNTINVIQGQAGVHKSRFAAVICSALISNILNNKAVLNFKKNNFDLPITIVYVDTERNIKEQFPSALQKIQVDAGFSVKDHPDNFKYLSLINISRSERFSILSEFLKNIRSNTLDLLFIVLDVSTDCIEDFNNVDKSMGLIDHMNMEINNQNVVFLCVIHENPGNEKARGHFGTELKNKASTVIQISFVKNGQKQDTELIVVKFLKSRNNVKGNNFYLKYNDEAKGLVIPSYEEISLLLEKRTKSATKEEVIKEISVQFKFGNPVNRQDLVNYLAEKFEVSKRTIEARIKSIVASKFLFTDLNGIKWILDKSKNGSLVQYMLSEVNISIPK